MDNENKTTIELGNAPLTGLLLKYAVPAILGMMVTSIYNITDQVFIGNIIGMYGNAATNVTFPINNITMAFAQLIGIGAAAGFNLSRGAKKDDDAKKYIYTGLGLVVFFSIFLTALYAIFKEPLLWFCGATQNSFDLANTYLAITLFGYPCMMIIVTTGMFIRGDGSPRYAMLCTSIGAVINIGLDWIFMKPFNLGIAGAAYATIIGQWISAIISICYFLKFKAFKFEFKNILHIDLKLVANIVKLGVPGFVMHILLMTVNITLNRVLVKYGAMSIYGEDIPLAIAGIVMKINSVVIAVAVGFGHGAQPIWAFNMGAENFQRVKDTWKKAAISTFIICSIIFILFQTMPRQIIGIFGSGSDLYFSFGEIYLKRYMMMVPVFGLQPLTTEFFSSIGEYKKGLILSLSRQGFLFIPLLLILSRCFGIDGALFAAPIADGIAVCISLTLVTLCFKDFNKKTK